jgi:hypothetical protein
MRLYFVQAIVTGTYENQWSPRVSMTQTYSILAASEALDDLRDDHFTQAFEGMRSSLF